MDADDAEMISWGYQKSIFKEDTYNSPSEHDDDEGEGEDSSKDTVNEDAGDDGNGQAVPDWLAATKSTGQAARGIQASRGRAIRGRGGRVRAGKVRAGSEEVACVAEDKGDYGSHSVDCDRESDEDYVG